VHHSLGIFDVFAIHCFAVTISDAICGVAIWAALPDCFGVLDAGSNGGGNRAVTANDGTAECVCECDHIVVVFVVAEHLHTARIKTQCKLKVHLF
jgi:hypothetical protein